jgi:hypothetical protein
MKKLFLTIFSIATLYSCSTTTSYKNASDLKSLEKVTKYQFLEYLNANAPKHLQDRICKNVFKKDVVNENISKIEATTCFSPLLKEMDVREIHSPFSDIDENSYLGSLAYFVNSHGILKASSPYTFGSNDTISGMDLVNALKVIKNMRK